MGPGQHLVRTPSAQHMLNEATRHFDQTRGASPSHCLLLIWKAARFFHSEIQIFDLQPLISIHAQLPKMSLDHRTNYCKLMMEHLRDSQKSSVLKKGSPPPFFSN